MGRRKNELLGILLVLGVSIPLWYCVIVFVAHLLDRAPH